MKKPNMRRRRKAPMGVPRVGGAKKEQPPMTSARREQLRVVFRRVIGEVKRLKEEEGEWHRWSEIENGVPVVDLLKHMNLVRLRLATNELLIFVIFYLIFAFICIQARGAQTDQLFKQSQTVKNGLFSFPGPLGEPRLFDEIEGPDDLWYFLRGPLPMTVFQSAWYNGDAMKKVETGYILHTLHAVGGYRLRQLRVRNDSCWDANEEELNQRKPGQWNQPDRTCYPVFSAAAEQRGDGGGVGDPKSPETWFAKFGRHRAVVCLSLHSPGPLEYTGPSLINTHAVQLFRSAAHIPQQSTNPPAHGNIL